MAGAVGMEVISPMPMAPQATSRPGFSTMIALISGIWLALNSPSVPNFCRWPAIRQRVILRQGESHAHDHAALDLALAGGWVDRLAHIVGRRQKLNFSVLPHHAQMRGVAVGYMADRVGYRCAQGVGLG